MTASALDAAFMRQALDLAMQGAGRTNPNPLVGAVLVHDGRVIGRGWHERYGGPHAERNALDDCLAHGEDPRGATAYVTLEPCSHHGHQPPCADALVEAGVARVVTGSSDPNPKVAGAGIARLRSAGTEVVEGVERAACDAINQVFFHYITSTLPYVVAKWAMTADGRIACSGGDARWITGEAARMHGHALRNRLAAIMVGSGTVAADDPLLTCRLPSGRTPLRVVCDSHLSISPKSALVTSVKKGPVLVACASLPETRTADEARRAAVLVDAGVEIVGLPGPDGRIDLPALMAELARREIDSVLVEGGARLHGAMFDAGLVDEVVAYIAPKIVGDSGAPGPVAGKGAPLMADALALGRADVGTLGIDVRISWRVAAGSEDGSLPCVSAGPLGPSWEQEAQRLGLRTLSPSELPPNGTERACSDGLFGSACSRKEI